MSQSETIPSRDRRAFAVSVAGAFAIAIFLSWLTYGKLHPGAGPAWLAMLPTLAAVANTGCAVSLLCGRAAIRRRRINEHRNFMLAAVAFSAVFFAAYVTRHYFHGDTSFAGAGLVRSVYLFVLATHILGSVVVLVLLPQSLRFAAIGRFASHKALNRWLLPVWIYVSATGVAVYFALAGARAA